MKEYDWGTEVKSPPQDLLGKKGFQLHPENRFVNGSRCVHKVSPPPKPVKPVWRYVKVSDLHALQALITNEESHGWHYVKTKEIQYASPDHRYDAEFWRRSGY